MREQAGAHSPQIESAARRPHLLHAALYLWAAPNTAFGLALGSFALLFGARVRVEQGALEFSGGYLGQCICALPVRRRFVAITLGHVILAIDSATAERVRAHEQVHVRQYERWGPFFLPAYLGSSLAQLARGRDPYLENHFEREARSKAS